VIGNVASIFLCFLQHKSVITKVYRSMRKKYNEVRDYFLNNDVSIKQAADKFGENRRSVYYVSLCEAWRETKRIRKTVNKIESEFSTIIPLEEVLTYD